MDSPDGIDFLFNGGPVGVLAAETVPDDEGILSYMPYRSGSHRAMHQAIGEGDTPECTYVRDGIEYSFVVDSCPGYGRLAVRDVRVV